jgi:hypothetical protein
MSEAVIAAMAECGKVCPQLHLPVQSGSDRVLSMERGYDAAAYLRLVERLRRAVPGLALSTDIIVGFPGEEEEDYRATVELMKAVRYDSAFLFKYSPREATKAFKWAETVDEDEKSRRLQEIIALQERTRPRSTPVSSDTPSKSSPVTARRPGWPPARAPTSAPPSSRRAAPLPAIWCASSSATAPRTRDRRAGVTHGRRATPPAQSGIMPRSISATAPLANVPLRRREAAEAEEIAAPDMPAVGRRWCSLAAR